MSSIGSPAPSGEGSEQSRQGDSAASADKGLVKKQQDSNKRGVSPEPSTSTGNKNEERKSRRKPKVTRKVVESEEEDTVIGGIGFEAIDDLLNAMVDPMETSVYENQDKPPAETAAPKAASPIFSKENLCNDVIEDEEFVLPEGTVVVQPEEVREDQDSQFQGPEFKTSGGRRQVMKGDIDNEIIHCTACNKQINSNSSANTKRHPVLKVLICKKCYKWYTSDEIDQDSDGMDEQCRWCGDGGDLLLCDSCNNAFCKGCIRRNLGRKELSEILDGDGNTKWQCYVCDPKPLAALIHNCTQIIKSVEAKEKENSAKPEKGKKEKEKEKQKQKAEESSSSTTSGTKLTKSTSKALAASQIKGAQKMSSVNVSPLLGGAQQVPVAVTTRGVTYIVNPADSIAPQQGTVYQKAGNKLFPASMPPVVTKLAVQSGGLAQMIPDNWNITEHNATHILDRVLAATQSMNMLLFSLKDDVKKKVQGAGKQEAMRAKSEMAVKLKRALHAYKKSFQDISSFANASKPRVPTQPTGAHPKMTSLISSKKVKKSTSQVEVIELSDSDDDTKSCTSNSNQKMPPSDKDKSQSSGGEGKDDHSSSGSSKSKSGFNLKVALFSKTSQSTKKTSKDKIVSEHDPKIARSEQSKEAESESESTKSGTAKESRKSDQIEEPMETEVTEIDLDATEAMLDKEAKEDEMTTNSDTNDKIEGATSNEEKGEPKLPKVAIKQNADKKNQENKSLENGAKGESEDSDDLPDLLNETERNSDSDVLKEKKDSDDQTAGENKDNQDDLFGSLKFEPLFDIASLDSSKRSPSADMQEPDAKKLKKTTTKRSREDIEAQRMLHKELLEDSSDSDKSEKENDPTDTTSEETSEEKTSKVKSSGEEYVPEKETRESRKERLKSSAAAKFKALREARRKHREKIKRMEESESDDDSDAEDKRKRPKKKETKERSDKEDKKKKSKKKVPKGSSEDEDEDEEKKPKKGARDGSEEEDKKKSKKKVAKDSSEEEDKKTKKKKKVTKDSSEEEDKKKKTKKKKKVTKDTSEEEHKKKKKKKKVPNDSTDDETETETTEKQRKKEKPKKKAGSSDSASEDSLPILKKKLAKKKDSDSEEIDSGKKKHKASKSSRRKEKGKANDVLTSSEKSGSDDDDSFDESLEDEIEKLAKAPDMKKGKKNKDDEKTKQKSKKFLTEEERIKKAHEKVDAMEAKGKLGRKALDQTGKKKKDLITDLSSGEEEASEEEDQVEMNGKDSEEEKSDQKLAKLQEDQEDSDENARAKKALLFEGSTEEESEDSDFERTKIKRGGKSGGGRSKKEPEEDGDDSSSEMVEAKKLKTTKLLDTKISDSDSDFVSPKKSKKKKKKAASSDEDVSESESNYSSSSSEEIGRSKKGKGKGRKRKRSSDSSSTDSGKKKKKKGRKRRAKMATDSSAESEKDGESGSEENDIGDTPGKKRKKIRKVIKDKNLKKETISAAKAEEQRRARIVERQKLFNEVTVTDEQSPTKCPVTTKLVLDIDEDTKKTLVEVDRDLIKKLKPHQVEAVKFLWNCCCESVERMKEEEGSGCILAHCMGLGKTLSTISFIHTLFTNEKRTKIRTALIVCPLNTVLNWQNEWNIWFSEKNSVEIFELSSVKDNYSRSMMLKDWQKEGGVCILGYEMYRNLSKHRNIKSKKQKQILTEALVSPGPDVVVCDEGHILKNGDSAISKAMNLIKTRRRIVLTGTPLQNNLGEYHCMVDFVKPNLLGTRKEFSNRFINPITNGQASDATPRDVKLMKKRAHIIHETLAGCVQRKDYSALTKYLLPKHEYIIAVRITPVQIKLYEEYLRKNFSEEPTVRGGRLFSDYQNLMKIWTHPWMLKLDEIRQENKRMFDDESDFVDDSYSSEDSFSDKASRSSPDDDADVLVLSGSEDDQWKPKGKGRSTRSRAKQAPEAENTKEVVNNWKTRSRGGAPKEEEEEEEEEEKKVSNEWWAEYVSMEDKFNMNLGGKIMLLAEVLKMCDSIGDKVLVFSQSLLSLDLIEDFLDHWDSCQDTEDEKNKNGALLNWSKGIEYFRMDGSTSPSLRQTWCDLFNDPKNTRARLFLISTKAGSLGINLVAANRVIVFDASWNPTHDIQSIFRVYRFGQLKPVYVYRFLAQGTMEEKIYERQVTKQSLSQRVIDEHQIDRHFTHQDLRELYNFRPDRLDDPNRKERPTPKLPKDRLLAELLTDQPKLIVNYHEHDSLLENRPEEDLTEEERKAAWEEFELEKKGMLRQTPQYGAYGGAHGMGQSNNIALFNAMVSQMQGQRSGAGNYTDAQIFQSIMPDAQQIAAAIYSENPGISHEDLQARVQQYIHLRMENETRHMYSRQQHDIILREEMAKMERLSLERQRQQEAIRLLEGGMPEGSRNLLQQLMAAGAPNAANAFNKDRP